MFITFCVILVTLVGQGLTLPLAIRWLGLSQAGRRERALVARVQGAKEALARLDNMGRRDHYPHDIIESLRRHHQARLSSLQELQGREGVRHDARREVIEAERRRIYELREQGEISEEIRREIEHELDLEEARVARQPVE